MTTGDKIKLLRKQRDWTQDELAEKLGYTDRSSIAKIESGGVDLPESRIKQICEIFNVTPAYFFDVEEKEPDNVIYPNFNRVPLFGDIACGDPITAVEIFDGDVDCPDNIHADFALRCKGDSMINARIFDGDIVYIHAQPVVDNGQIAAVYVDGEATLKRVKLFDDHIVLEPENPMYKPLVFWNEEQEKVAILGLAVAFTSIIK